MKGLLHTPDHHVRTHPIILLSTLDQCRYVNLGFSAEQCQRIVKCYARGLLNPQSLVNNHGYLEANCISHN